MTLLPILAEKLSSALLPFSTDRFTPRDAQLPAVPGKVHAIIGMRRAGKTTFLRQLQAQQRNESGPETAIYLSFDDDRLVNLDLAQLGFLIEEYYRRFPSHRGGLTVRWLFDEIQYVDGWERFVRRILDSENVEIFVSGSSARMLSREVHTSLRGRGLPTVIHPFSFREFLRHRSEEPPGEPRSWTPGDRSLIERRFREFLVEGGFPETQGLPSGLRIELLQSYVDGVLFRDIVERHRVSQIAALRWLVRQCLRNPAASFSAHRLHQDLRAQGLGVTKETVHSHLGHLFDAFLLQGVFFASESERQRNSNPRKIYPVDPGLIRAFDSSGRSNVGHALETVVGNELQRRRSEFGYWKTSEGYEVDFVSHDVRGNRELIQVCAETSSPETLNRELRALLSAGRSFPDATRRLLVLDRDDSDHVARLQTEGVVVQSVSDWLLTPQDL